MQQCFLNSLAKVSEVHVQPSSLFPPYKVFVRPSELFLSTGLRSGDREGWKLCRGCYQIYLVTIYCFPMGLHLSQITSYELYSKIKDYWKMFLHKFLKYFIIHVVFIMVALDRTLSKQNMHKEPCHLSSRASIFTFRSTFLLETFTLFYPHS